MKKITIEQAIIQVLQKEIKPLDAKEIFEKINNQNLYEFKSKTPINIIQSALRKSCEGVRIKKSKEKKLFKMIETGKYSIIT